MNGSQDLMHGEMIREMCDRYESALGRYQDFTTADGGRYRGPVELMEDIIEELRNEVPDPEDEFPVEEDG